VARGVEELGERGSSPQRIVEDHERSTIRIASDGELGGGPRFAYEFRARTERVSDVRVGQY
jgi:hypothetical protein